MVLYIGRQLAAIAEELDIPDMASPLRAAVESWMSDSVEVILLIRLASLPDLREETQPVEPCLWIVNGKEMWL